ncbi:membrane protein [Staphylococcus phage pSco-10]|nr:membrane protein [Staphylococcus phage pSco-10]
MVAIFVVITTIFFNKYQDAKEDKDKYQRIVEIYQKADDNNGDTKKKYVKRLNEAEEELRKVKKETNYKGYNEKSKKERQKEDKKTRDKIYDVTGDDDLILVKNNIEFSDKVGKPEILISEDGVGTITVPTNSGYEKQTVGSIITSVLGSPYLSQYSPSTDSLGIIDSNVYPNTANSISEGIDASNDNVPTDNSIITNPVNPTTPSDILPPADNPSVGSVPTDNPTIPNPVEPGIPSDVLPGNTVDNNSGDVDNTDNPNPPPPGYTDADGGKGSGGGGSIEPPPPIEEPSDNGNTGGNEGEVTPEPEPEPSEPGTEQPNEKPDEGNDNEEEPSEPSDNPDENEEEPSENPDENEVEEPSEPDDKADEEDTNEDTSEDEQTTEQPEEQPDDNTTDNEDKIEEE